MLILCSEESYSRQDQDNFAIESYERSNNAIKQGLLKMKLHLYKLKTKKMKSLLTLMKTIKI